MQKHKEPWKSKLDVFLKIGINVKLTPWSPSFMNKD